MDYPYTKFGDFSFSRFGFTCGQTDSQTDTHRITDTAKRLTPTTFVGVSNDKCFSSKLSVYTFYILSK